MPKVAIDMPPRSMVPLSYLNQFSATPGVNYPAYIQDVQKSDEVYFDLDNLVKTLPLNNTFFGVNKLQFDLFFIPERFYNPALHDDTVNFDPFSTSYPHVNLTQNAITINTPQPDDGQLPRPGVHVSSLHHFTGVPEIFLSPLSTGGQVRAVNAVPALGYIDIHKSYYANTQEANTYFLGGDSTSGSSGGPFIYSVPLQRLDEFRSSILRSDPDDLPDMGGTLGTLTPIQNPLNSSHAKYPMGGLFLRTYLPDRFTVFVNNDGYASTLSSALVDVSAGSFNLDQLRFAEALNGMLQRTLVAGRRYSDWQKVQFGGSLKGPVECPEFICSHSSDMYFEDVVQTSGATDEDNYLGSLGSRGVGSIMKRKIRYYVKENGFLMGIFSIIPRVSYYEGIRHWCRWSRVSDRHVPAMDGIGFQDLDVDSLCSRNSVLSDDPFKPTSGSVGKQPAWVEYMTRVNELHGQFAKVNSYMPLVYARRFHQSTDDQLPGTFQYTTYINPKGYNYPFADASLSSENYWCQFRFRVRVRRAISKRVMPHLANR